MLDPEIDIVTPSVFTDMTSLHRKYKKLRTENPVCWMEPDGYRPFWALTKHKDVMDVAKQNNVFLNGPRTQLFPAVVEDYIKMARPDGVGLIRSIVHMDGPEHKVYRNLVQPWFMPGNLKKVVEPKVATLAAVYSKKMMEMEGECDFVRDVALWYPLRVIMSILGVPDEDEPLMLKLTQEVFGPFDPDNQQGDAPPDMTFIIDQFFDYFRDLAKDRRRNPKNDLASVIANASVNGADIPDFEAMSYFTVIATAGHDTTSSSSAGGLLALIEHPEEFVKLRAAPEMMATAVDEMIRWVSPVRHFMRTAASDHEIRGQTIKAGQDVLLAYPSANRDDDVFEQPDMFITGRKPNPHLAFGFGAHYCLGHMLAKMEIAALFQELIKSTSHFELNGTPSWTASNFIGGLKTLPIRFAAS